MKDRLQQYYQVKKELTRSSRFNGVIEVSKMTRLKSMIKSDSGDINVSFQMLASDYDLPLVKGNIETCLTIECQRCLGPLEMPFQHDFELLVDATDDQMQEASIDSLYSSDGLIDIYEVIEDELILGFPLVAMHNSGNCNEYWQVSDPVPENAVKENPFSVLENLKTTQ